MKKRSAEGEGTGGVGSDEIVGDRDRDWWDGVFNGCRQA